MNLQEGGYAAPPGPFLKQTGKVDGVQAIGQVDDVRSSASYGSTSADAA